MFSAVTVSNLYAAHPILTVIGSSFGVSGDRAGVVITLGQLGYTIGLFFVIPLGDVLRRRALLCALVVSASAGAVLAALMPSLPLLALAMAMLCVPAVGAHILVPLLIASSPPTRRGRVLVINNSAILAGIALSRVLYGAIGDRWGWRAVYLVAAALTALIGTAVVAVLPTEDARPRMSYAMLLRSTARLVVEEPTIRWAAATQVPVFAASNMTWLMLALLLTGPDYEMSVEAAGMFGLCAAVTVVTAPLVGHFLDRFGSPRSMALGCLTLVAGGIAMLFSTLSIGIVVIGLLLLIVGQQQVSTANQTRVLALRASARSRLNSVYLTANFLGGTTASLLAVVVYGRSGWRGVTIATLTLAVIAAANLAVETLTRRGRAAVRPCTANLGASRTSTGGAQPR